MKQTSERLAEEHLSGTALWEIHMAAYRWAREYAAGARILDYGCGTGYGAAFLSESAAHVTGYDVDPGAIDYATEHFGRPGVEFTTQQPAESHDLVLSFQVIEHVEPHAYLENVARALRPGGRLLLTTPNRSMRLWRWQKPWNRWHLTEYDRAGLTDLLRQHFSHVEPWVYRCPAEIEESEIARYRKSRLLLLPVTLIPWYVARFWLLNSIASIVAPGGQDSARTEGTVRIERGASESICLAAVAIR
jgi:SAM-dependent methyltransferase